MEPKVSVPTLAAQKLAAVPIPELDPPTPITAPPFDLLSDAILVFAEQDPVELDWNLFTLGVDDSGLTRLEFPRENEGEPPDAILQKPLWSPDGTRLLFRASGTGTDDRYIVMIDAAGTTRRLLSPTSGFADFPFWSPEGDRVLLAIGSPFLGGVFQTVIVDVDGTSQDFAITDEGALFEGRRVYFNLSPREGNTLYDAQWAPGGEDLFVVGFLDEPQSAGVDVEQVEIFRVNVASGRIVARVTRNAEDEAAFVVSPDGRSFALAQGEGPDRRVRFGRFSADRLQEIPDVVPDSEPRWAADSRHLVFSAPLDGGIAIADTRTGQVRIVGPQFARDPDIFCSSC